MMLPLPLNIWFEIAAFITSIYCYNTIKNKPLRWFIPFLFLVVLVELLGRYIRKIVEIPNSPLFNITIPLEYMFYTYLFYCFYNDRTYKQIAKTLLILIPIGVFANIVFIQGFYLLNTNVLTIGSCFIIILCCVYFIDLFKRDQEIVLLTEPMFWIATGLLFFNLGDLSYNLFFNYILQNDQDLGSKLFTSINSKLVYFLYTFISIGLLCTKKDFQRVLS